MITIEIPQTNKRCGRNQLVLNHAYKVIDAAGSSSQLMYGDIIMALPAHDALLGQVLGVLVYASVENNTQTKVRSVRLFDERCLFEDMGEIAEIKLVLR